jgi:hypothetical protein
MDLNDGDVAALAEQAAGRVSGPIEVRIEPDAGDDPYRWGQHFWLVQFRTGEGRTATARIAAEDTPDGAAARLAQAVRGLAPDQVAE